MTFGFFELLLYLLGAWIVGFLVGAYQQAGYTREVKAERDAARASLHAAAHVPASVVDSRVQAERARASWMRKSTLERVREAELRGSTS